MHVPPSHRHRVIKENVPHRDRAAVALYAEGLLSRDPDLRVAEAAQQAVETYRRDPEAVRLRRGAPPETPMDHRERIVFWAGACVIGVIYAFLTEYWWVFLVAEGLLLLLGAIHWLRSRGEAAPANPSSGRSL